MMFLLTLSMLGAVCTWFAGTPKDDGSPRPLLLVRLCAIAGMLLQLPLFVFVIAMLRTSTVESSLTWILVLAMIILPASFVIGSAKILRRTFGQHGSRGKN